MAQRGRGAAAGARPAARTGARSADPSGQGGSEAPRARAHRDEGRRPGLDLAAIRNRLRAVIEPAVTSVGLDLEDLVEQTEDEDDDEDDDSHEEDDAETDIDETYIDLDGPQEKEDGA